MELCTRRDTGSLRRDNFLATGSGIQADRFPLRCGDYLVKLPDNK